MTARGGPRAGFSRGIVVLGVIAEVKRGRYRPIKSLVARKPVRDQDENRKIKFANLLTNQFATIKS